MLALRLRPRLLEIGHYGRERSALAGQEKQ